MHRKIFLKLIIIILFVNLSYSSSNNFFQKMHEGTYIPILLPDNNYRWDQWQFSINTESNDLILQNGFILIKTFIKHYKTNFYDKYGRE